MDNIFAFWEWKLFYWLGGLIQPLMEKLHAVFEPIGWFWLLLILLGTAALALLIGAFACPGFDEEPKVSVFSWILRSCAGILLVRWLTAAMHDPLNLLGLCLILTLADLVMVLINIDFLRALQIPMSLFFFLILAEIFNDPTAAAILAVIAAVASGIMHIVGYNEVEGYTPAPAPAAKAKPASQEQLAKAAAGLTLDAYKDALYDCGGARRPENRAQEDCAAAAANAIRVVYVNFMPGPDEDKPEGYEPTRIEYEQSMEGTDNRMQTVVLRMAREKLTRLTENLAAGHADLKAALEKKKLEPKLDADADAWSLGDLYKKLAQQWGLTPEDKTVREYDSLEEEWTKEGMARFLRAFRQRWAENHPDEYVPDSSESQPQTRSAASPAAPSGSESRSQTRSAAPTDTPSDGGRTTAGLLRPEHLTTAAASAPVSRHAPVQPASGSARKTTGNGPR